MWVRHLLAGFTLLCFFSIYGCATTGVSPDSESHPKRTAVTKKMKKNPESMRPYSVEYEGKLSAVSGISDVISGNTIVLEQPWANRKRFELRKTPIYFKKNGKATSEQWLDIPWNVSNNKLCMSKGSCYQAYSDSSGQAYLMSMSTKLLAKVGSIETGDSHNVKAAYQARQERIRASNAAWGMVFAGLLSELANSGPSGGGYVDRSGGRVLQQNRRGNWVLNEPGSIR